MFNFFIHVCNYYYLLLPFYSNLSLIKKEEIDISYLFME
jgi:hypothetical protein